MSYLQITKPYLRIEEQTKPPSVALASRGVERRFSANPAVAVVLAEPVQLGVIVFRER